MNLILDKTKTISDEEIKRHREMLYLKLDNPNLTKEEMFKIWCSK